MSFKIIADLVLIIHFSIVMFIISIFFLIPIGYILNWQWQKNKIVRLLHIILMFIITAETIVGITCPLTLFENSLRGVFVSNSFITTWLTKLLFWELPSTFFLITYIMCFGLTIIFWIKFPPQN